MGCERESIAVDFSSHGSPTAHARPEHTRYVHRYGVVRYAQREVAPRQQHIYRHIHGSSLLLGRL